MDNNSNNIYAIIVTYNAMKWIQKCLECLLNSTVVVNIIVVDNASTDDTIRFIRENYHNVIIIENNNNLGFGKANNVGIEMAFKLGANHFFLCNQDLYVNPDAIEILARVQENNNVSIVSPIHMNGTFSEFDSGFFSAFSSEGSLDKFVADLVRNKCEESYECKYIPAAAWMINRQTIETIGGFDPIFFHYGEDRNYAQRIIYHKQNIRVVPQSIVGHDRFVKGNLKAFYEYSPYSHLINSYTDPCDRIFFPYKKRIIQHLVIIKHIIQCSLKFRFAAAFNLFKSWLKFWWNLNNIKQSVLNNREVKSNWLNL